MRAHWGDHVLDGEGRPIAGAAVYVYQHGTTTPITETIYTTDDTAGSTVASNPLSTSASGRYDIWLTDEKRVTLKITKAGFQDQTFDVDVIELNPTGASNITLRENSGANVGTRPRINLIEGTGIALTLADDGVDNEVDVTVATAAAYQALSALGTEGNAAGPITGGKVPQLPDYTRTTSLTTNYITNPSFEMDTAGWTASGATLSRTTTEAYVGAASLALAVTGAAQGTYYGFASGWAVGETWTFSAWIKSTTAQTIKVQFYALGSGTPIIQEKSVTGTGGWERISVSGVVPSGTTGLRVYIESVTAGTYTFYADGAQLEESSTATSYIDGDQGAGYAWTGTPHASTSTRGGTESIDPFRFGYGSPESAVTAPVGTLYLRADGAAGTTLYVKESGTAATGWKAIGGGMAIKSIQRGTVTIAGTLTSGTVTITAVDTAKTLLNYTGGSGNTGGDTTQTHNARMVLTNSTTITANRNSGQSGSEIVAYEVVEYA